ncbi:MAG: hypothetical protein U0798_04125 [Gemmataceae bacterium]
MESFEIIGYCANLIANDLDQLDDEAMNFLVDTKLDQKTYRPVEANAARDQWREYRGVRKLLTLITKRQAGMLFDQAIQNLKKKA